MFFGVLVQSCDRLPDPLLDPDPPDLSRCTRIEVHYQPAIASYYTGLSIAEQYGLLDPNELLYLRSMKTIVTEDEKRIRAFARIVANASSRMRLRGYTVPMPTSVRVVCHAHGKDPVSFIVHGRTLLADERLFKCSAVPLDSLVVEPPRLRSLNQRGYCAWDIEKLYTAGSLYYSSTAYPRPSEWCDAIAQVWRDQYTIDANGVGRYTYDEFSIAENFACPANDGYPAHVVEDATDEVDALELAEPVLVSHYAVNPHCQPDSPGDMVLLFEARAGWNQHGGPELFTFDNHDPKGGCVLLNDGTVKFIRTAEELHALRWE